MRNKLMVVLAALSLLVACDRPIDVNSGPDKIASSVAKYATDAVDYVTAAQNLVNAYTVAQGGRTPETDLVSNAIRDNVIPAAQRLGGVLRAYQATTDVNLKEATAKQILDALTSYEKVVSAAIGREAKVPANLASQLAATVTNIRDLIIAIRNTFGAPATTIVAPAGA